MSDEKEKKEKPVKPPSSLKKPIGSEKFEKRYIKYIEHPRDREFFTGCFERQDDFYIIRGNLTKDDVKKIKNILKWVKTNKKVPVKMVPLVFAGAVAAAIVIFFTIFANPLLSKLLEKSLEAVFEGKTDVRGFRLSVIKFEIKINSLTIANKNEPMTNLIDMGKTGIKMKPQAVLRGKVYIEEIRADTIRFGTPRKVSGALPDRPAKVKKEKDEKTNDGPPLIDLKNFDAKALLNQEFDKLLTPKLYDNAVALYNETLAKWQGEVENAKKQVEDLRTASQPLLNINTGNLRDIDTIRKTIQDISTMVSAIQSASNTASGLVSGIESDVNTARKLEQDARNALTDDINHLKSYIDMGGSGAFLLLEPYIRDMLSATAEQYLDYGLIGLDALEKLNAQSKKQPKSQPKPKKQKKVPFKGRDVIFPTAAYPAFYMGLLSSDCTVNSWNWDVKLKDVSSDPDLTKKPVSLDFVANETGGSLTRRMSFSGNADLRTDASQRFGANLKGGGFPLSVGNNFDKIGISGMAGVTALNFDAKGYTNGGFSTAGDIRVLNASLLEPKGTIAEAVAEAVSDAGNIDLGIEYIHNIGESDIFRIKSNLADLLARALKKLASAYAQKAMQEIERVVRERISQYIEGKFASKDQVDMLLKTARGDMAAVDQLKNSLNSKQNELEQKIKGIAEDAAKQALQDKLPAIPVPSLPSGGLRLPGR
jgi:uncharacterized protein (TIGR03545 family)